jgi:FMN-dependent NADH-azoreductase
MSKLLYIKSSPMGSRSRSTQVANAFVDTYISIHPEVSVIRKELIGVNLTPFDESAAGGKYAAMRAQEMELDEQAAWMGVENWIHEFKAAQIYVFAVPMHNFSIPYTLKHYIDLIVQPGYTFSYSPEEGYCGLLQDRRAFCVYARGGAYSGEAAALDFQQPYLETILNFIGITQRQALVVEPTLQDDPQAIEDTVQVAIKQAREAAAVF